MIRSILKEIIIVLLLLLAVILALGVMFYDYIPTNKIIPSVETYKTSETITNEIAEKITEENTVIVTYEITQDDIKGLKQRNEYTQGKANPFSTYVKPVEGTNDENNITDGNGNTNTNTNQPTNNSNNTDNKNNSNTFYKNTGTK